MCYFKIHLLLSKISRNWLQS